MKEVKVRFSYSLYNDLRRAAKEEETNESEIIKRGVQVYGFRRAYAKEGSTLATADASRPKTYEVVDDSYNEDDIFDFNEIPVRLSDKAYKVLMKIADEAAVSPLDVMRKGLRLYLRIRAHQKNGRNLVVFEVRALKIAGIAKVLKGDTT